LGYDLKIDGKFGDKTKAAVVDFQKKNKLSQDGIVGTNTWTALNTVYGSATNTGINPGAMGMTITSNNYVSKKEKQKTSYNIKICHGGEKIGNQGYVYSTEPDKYNFTKEEAEKLIYEEHLNGWIKSTKTYDEIQAKSLPEKIS
ncbi:MAG: peptidoglycan-binding domain-containing protein, partial [Clostridium sp.]|nr:peptidoglycan-binding domain-containing protein [Clostridium sp.]